MDKLINTPKFTAFDSNGDPLNGGLVYTYESGTTTPKTTYSDRALSSANANPVVLDSRGEASIFCTGLLKIVVKDSSGATLYTMDNLRASYVTSLSDDDADTLIQVEESADEDTIRFDAGGTEQATWTSTTTTLKPGGTSVATLTASTVTLSPAGTVNMTVANGTVIIRPSNTVEATFNSDGLTLKSGASVNEFSTDGTLGGNSDDAVPTEKAVKTYGDTVIGGLAAVPSGTIIAWPNETVPAGYLECAGAAVSRTTYAALFAVIADLYGAGDGSTTFDLPDFRGRFLRAWAHDSANDPDRASRTKPEADGSMTAGDHVGTVQADAYKSHSHNIKITGGSGPTDKLDVTTSSNNYTTFSSDASGGNETRPLNSYVMYCIKY